jgi:hypothetical protein
MPMPGALWLEQSDWSRATLARPPPPRPPAPPSSPCLLVYASHLCRTAFAPSPPSRPAPPRAAPPVQSHFSASRHREGKEQNNARQVGTRVGPASLVRGLWRAGLHPRTGGGRTCRRRPRRCNRRDTGSDASALTAVVLKRTAGAAVPRECSRPARRSSERGELRTARIAPPDITEGTSR